jgi:cold shock CspA family protein
MSAEDGVIVSTDGTETSSDISETAASIDESAEETVSTTEDTTTEDTTTEDTTTEDSSSSDESDKEIVSTSFSDFALYTDSSATELQKETFFNENFKDKYVTWTGTVTTVSESYGSYSVGVKHSPNTLTSDVYVKMRDDQKDKLLQLKEGSEITYTAKMTRYGEILGMSAEDGVIE